ncbi:MAG TPA: 4-(cytidine 5'-diphospho)-2-C-methyl-D-erythritol kinase [Lachnospiraceae bacterium]|nr:4-(cytidine 5'-diphospho)-2-C-methyl-D-erythritol kinase [Lachnospiraceae bacterium]
MEQINLKAMAKINLALDVIRKREDGYHEVRMIMQTLHLFDKLSIKKVQKKGIFVKTNLYFLPTDENNLVYKAAKLLTEEFEIRQGVCINLQKYIPVAAGMAGGSSDAAAVLFGLNRLFKLGLSTEQLMERGVRIGADVPYCIMRGTALSEGIGEILTPLPPMPECFVLAAKPAVSVSTKFVYENLKIGELAKHPDIDGMTEAIKAQDLRGIAALMSNVLETVTIREYPVIRQIKEHMMEGGALNALMSGSGPTVFGLFEEERTAWKAYRELKEKKLAKQVFLTDIYNRRNL